MNCLWALTDLSTADRSHSSLSLENLERKSDSASLLKLTANHFSEWVARFYQLQQHKLHSFHSGLSKLYRKQIATAAESFIFAYSLTRMRVLRVCPCKCLKSPRRPHSWNFSKKHLSHYAKFSRCFHAKRLITEEIQLSHSYIVNYQVSSVNSAFRCVQHTSQWS